jgi:hypothetical protein
VALHVSSVPVAEQRQQSLEAEASSASEIVSLIEHQAAEAAQAARLVQFDSQNEELESLPIIDISEPEPRETIPADAVSMEETTPPRAVDMSMSLAREVAEELHASVPADTGTPIEAPVDALPEPIMVQPGELQIAGLPEAVLIQERLAEMASMEPGDAPSLHEAVWVGSEEEEGEMENPSLEESVYDWDAILYEMKEPESVPTAIMQSIGEDMDDEPKVTERPGLGVAETLPDISEASVEVAEIFEEVQQKTADVEPAALEKALEPVVQVLQLVREIRSDHEDSPQAVVQIEADLTEVLQEFFTIVGVETSQEDLHKVVEFLMSLDVPESSQAKEWEGFTELFSGQGTHEGRRYALQPIKAKLPIQSLLGKIILLLYSPKVGYEQALAA